jgi:phenylalanyl-tRNA synthetase beta chain
MKISYKWLGELVELTLGPMELAEKLTSVGLPVESVQERGGDYIFDIDVTSNRPDALSHIGVAREVALICGTELNSPEIRLSEGGARADSIASVQIADPDLCSRYAARLICGVKVGSSPPWLADKLEALGQRPINNIADITNYVMFEMGQPTHAFDLDKLRGRRILVRRARPGEELITLDGIKRSLEPDMLVIADAERPVALAGIMGGLETEISDQTRNVLIESAHFDPISIRRAARKLGLSTEASYRFERWADPQAQVRAADRVAQLIAEIAGGEILRGAIDVCPRPIRRDPIRLRLARFERLIGFSVQIEQASHILRALGFDVEFSGNDQLLAVPPSFRADVSCEEDLIEEIARHIGYDRVGLTLPPWGDAGSYLAGEDRRRQLRQLLATLGFNEAISLSFVNEERDLLFRPRDKSAVQIANPLDANQATMRTSLLAGLLGALERNFNYGNRDVKLFEIGKVFQATGSRPLERESLALVMSGAAAPGDWRQRRPVDFYDLKGAVEAILEALKISGFTIERPDVEYLHPGQSAALVRDGHRIAFFGRLHPRTAALYKFRQAVFVAQIDLGHLLELPAERASYSALPRLPASCRDISAILPESVAWSELERAIADLGIREIVSVRLFDVYKGGGVPEGARSLAFRVTYRGQGRTLTDQEVNRMHDLVRGMLQSRFGAQLR